MDPSPLTESEEREIAASLAGRPPLEGPPPPSSGSDSASFSRHPEAPEEDAPTETPTPRTEHLAEGSGSSDQLPASMINSEDAERALTELDEIVRRSGTKIEDPLDALAGMSAPSKEPDESGPDVAAGEDPGEDASAAPQGYAEPPPLPVVQEDPEDLPAKKDAREHEIFFGELARLQRFVTAEQVAESLRIAEKLRAEGRSKKIGKIMVKLGFLTATQAKYLLRLQRTPDPIEGYKLLERRGQGGMGVVYRAVQKSLKREVALKILAPKWAAHARFLQRFFREAKLAGTLNHKNLVSAIDVGESNGLHYYAMEFVDGWSVAEMLKEDGPFEEGEALDIAIQVARALAAASEQAIVHRDVKPENILVTPDGVAKLADLGLSKQLTSDCSITTEGKTLGTPFYVSPELARGVRDVDVRSDIYSLGATLYHMLSGAPPFDGDQPAMIMARHIAEPHVPLRRVRPDVTQATSKLIDRMMQKDPAKRYADADELIQDISAIRKGKNPFATTGARPVVRERPARVERESPQADPESASARVPAQPARRTGERAVYRPPSGAGAGAAVAIAAGILLVVVIAVILIAKPKETAQASGEGGRASATSSAGATSVAASTAPAPPPPPSSPERDRAIQLRLVSAVQEVPRLLEQGKLAEAAALAEALERDAQGTPFLDRAGDLRARVTAETRKALGMAIFSARRALADGDPRLAKDHIDGVPRTDLADLERDRAHLREEIERALRRP